MTTQEFLKFFTGSVFQTFKDKEEMKGWAEVFLKYDEAKFKNMQRLGCGIYFTPNFCEGGRKGTDLVKLNAVFADLDVTKKEEKMPTEEIKEKKAVLKNALLGDIISPNFIIDTKHGLQPLWLLEDIELTEESKSDFTLAVKGIIEWSKKFGCKGDKVFDLVHVVRLPGYFHLKGEPYKCEAEEVYTDRVSLKYLRETFPYEEPKKETVPVKQFKKGLVSMEIDNIDIRELMERAFAYVGRRLEFDKQGRMIIDGILTGNFQGKQGDRGFIASTSHEPFDGNRVTAVAKVLAVTTKEAYAWIKEQYGLNEGKLRVKQVIQKPVEKIKYAIDEEVKIFTWGTPGLDREISPMAGQLNFITGTTGMGKTTFSFDVAQKNAKLGHKVLYISLEQDRVGLINRLARSSAGITKSEWRVRSEISENKKMRFRMKVDEINQMENLILFGFGGTLKPTTENIFATIKEINPELVFIDNFDDIAKDNAHEYTEQNRTVQELKDFAVENDLPINVLHHRNAKKSMDGIGAVRGSGKITDTSWTTLKCSREWDDDASPKDNAKFVIKHEKDREFGTFSVAWVYWQNGTFNDNYI